MPRPTAKQKNVRRSPRKHLSLTALDKTRKTPQKLRNIEKLVSTNKNNNNDKFSIATDVQPLSSVINEYTGLGSNKKAMKNNLAIETHAQNMPDLDFMLADTKPPPMAMSPQNVKAYNVSDVTKKKTEVKTADLKSKPIILTKKTHLTVEPLASPNSPSREFKNMPQLNFSIDNPPPLIPLDKSNKNNKRTQKTVNTSKANPRMLPTENQTVQNSRKQKKPSIRKESNCGAQSATETTTPLQTCNRNNRQRKRLERTPQSANIKTEPTAINKYVAEGMAEDCECLIENCLKVYKLNFEKFCDIWKQMNFARIFHERSSSAELAEFSEEAILIAKRHMISQNTNFEVKVAGLFLVYALLNLQPFESFAALKLTPDDVPAVKDLEIEARKQRRHDVLYILGNVLIKGPCQFQVALREVGLEHPIKKYFDGSVHMPETGTGVFKKTNETISLLKDLTQLEEKLKGIKKTIEQRNMNSNLFYAKHIAGDLYEELTQLIPGLSDNLKPKTDSSSSVDGKEGREPVAPEPSRYDMMRSIREKAMTNVVEPMRHLTGVEERQLDKSLTPPGASSQTYKGESETRKSPLKGKGKGKGKSRSTAVALHNMFKDAIEEIPKEVVTPSLQTLNQNLPILDLTDEIDAKTAKVIETALPIKTQKKRPPQSHSVDEPRVKVHKSIDSFRQGTVEVSPPSSEFSTYKRDQPRKYSSTNSELNSNTNKIVTKTKNMRKQIHKTLPDFDKTGDLKEEDSIIVAELDGTNESHNKILDVIHKMTKDELQPTDNEDVIHETISESEINSEEQVLITENQKINIQLDTIPIIHNINKNIEIEIIDLYQGDDDKSENESLKDRDLDVIRSTINKDFVNENVRAKPTAYTIKKRSPTKTTSIVETEELTLKVAPEKVKKVYSRRKTRPVVIREAEAVPKKDNSKIHAPKECVTTKSPAVSKGSHKNTQDISNMASIKRSPTVSKNKHKVYFCIKTPDVLKESVPIKSPRVSKDCGKYIQPVSNDSGTKNSPAVSIQEKVENNPSVSKTYVTIKNTGLTKESEKHTQAVLVLSPNRKRQTIKTLGVLKDIKKSPTVSKHTRTKSPVVSKEPGIIKGPDISNEPSNKDSPAVLKRKLSKSPIASKEPVIKKSPTISKNTRTKSLDLSKESSYKKSPVVTEPRIKISTDTSKESSNKEKPAVSTEEPDIKECSVLSIQPATKSPASKRKITTNPVVSTDSDKKSPVVPKESDKKSPVVPKESDKNSPVVPKESDKKSPVVSTDSVTKSPVVPTESDKKSPVVPKESKTIKSPLASRQSCAKTIQSETTKSVVTSSINSKLEKSAARRMRAERRESKRLHIKSRFKKLGILNIANFDDEDEL